MDPNNPSPAPPSSPRPLTPAIRRALWIEPRVRPWLLMILLLLLTFVGYVVDRLYARHVEMDLITTGVVMQARIVGAANKISNQRFSSADAANIIMDWPEGQQEIDGCFLSNGGVVGSTVTLHVDPKDHTRWTERSEPTPMLDSLFVGVILLPLIPVLWIIAVIKMRRLRTVWQLGAAKLALVFDRKQTPVAPLSYAIRCSLKDSTNKELFTVFVPQTGRGLARGDLIWVLVPPNSGKPLAVLWMDEAAAGAEV